MNFDPNLTDNKAALSRPDHYIRVDLLTKPVLKSWQSSLFSFEWMTPDGTIKSLADLPEKERVKRQQVEDAIRQGQALERPVLGIGMMDNIEIGSGRAVFLTLAAHGLERISVHIPKAHEDAFRGFL